MITTTHKKILIPLALVRSRLRLHCETTKNQTTKNQTMKTNTLFDSSARLMKSRLAFVTFSLLCIAPLAHSQTATRPDLDRDGIPNISDPDVDNDGVRNGADLNIDGGVAKSGPLKGRYIGDRIANDNAAELDMDADGLLDNAANESDIDGDGLADNSKLELDIDADGRPDTAVNETDIDGDGLADNAANETDIDGDGLDDGGRGEVDTDGDGSANGLDGDVDGDGLANNSDADMHGTGVLNDIFAGADEAYASDASAASTIAFVTAEIRRSLQIPASDTGLRVRVSANPFGSLITGVWRYLSPDNIQVYAKWSYPANNPAAIQIAAVYRYNGPYSDNTADYTDPANYYISEESRVYSQYPGGGITFVSWMPQQPAGFYLGAIFQTYTSIPASLATGGFYYGTASGEPSDFTPPYQTLVNALSAYPNLTSDPQNLSFWGSLGSAPGLPSLQPLINLQRTVMQVSRAWYGQLEAQQLR